MGEQKTCDWCGAPLEVREPYASHDWGAYHLGDCEQEAAADAAASTQEEIGVEDAREAGKL